MKRQDIGEDRDEGDNQDDDQPGDRALVLDEGAPHFLERAGRRRLGGARRFQDLGAHRRILGLRTP